MVSSDPNQTPATELPSMQDRPWYADTEDSAEQTEDVWGEGHDPWESKQSDLGGDDGGIWGAIRDIMSNDD